MKKIVLIICIALIMLSVGCASSIDVSTQSDQLEGNEQIGIAKVPIVDEENTRYISNSASRVEPFKTI